LTCFILGRRWKWVAIFTLQQACEQEVWRLFF
jgi:hypothetical protein